MSDDFIESSLNQADEKLDSSLRPQYLQEFLGQDSLREQLDILIQAAQQRNEPLCHCLFYGPPGLGKTTLANILAKTMGTHLVVTSGPVIEKPGDLAGVLTNLKEGDILFIDEIHRLQRTMEEYLYPAMEDFALDLLIDSGPSARSVQIKLQRFTLVGATTKVGSISHPMRSRFGFTSRLDYYDRATLTQILRRSAFLLNLSISEGGLQAIAQRSRGTPRIANNLLKWVRDFAQIRRVAPVEASDAHAALQMLRIDEKGLDEMDKKVLECIIDSYGGGPVGLSTLAIALSEDPITLSEVYEPYLILQGFLKRTPRGREVTPLGYQHLGRPLTPMTQE